jgi:hypothetical protein
VHSGGLATEVTREELSKHFSRFGRLADTVVMMDRETNRSRGFGFVTFESEDSVERALDVSCSLCHSVCPTMSASATSDAGSTLSP